MSKKKSQQRLTEKQEAFCQAMVDPACKSASDAYRKIYNAAKMKPETINRAASALLKNYKVATRIKELKTALERKVLKKFSKTLDDILADIEEARKGALSKEQYAVAIKGSDVQAELLGMKKQKVESDSNISIRWERDGEGDNNE